MFLVHTLLFLSFHKTPPVNANASEPWAPNKTPKPRVFHGQDVATHEYPYVAVIMRLRTSNRHLRTCTISIIMKNYGLTAAHCSRRQRYQHYVWYGNHTVSPLETGAYTAVSEFIVHPSFLVAGGLTGNDIALVRFSDIILPRYGRLSAVDHLTMMGLPVLYIGGGLTKKVGDDDTRQLQVGEGAIVACPAIYKELANILLCVGPKCSSRQDTGAKGDSGGPLFFDDRIIGVMSFGDQNPFASIVAFAPVSPYLDWINNVLHST
ncbi:hypothetical protein B5X24_HaOG212861 [Helicoverpa armigera]|uniref:Peptidase S1 domain-containing protein n=1 Tax=Helicoverpa armigera TaxID=29058 RepID=A0A2W1BEF7_HELAM|nr:hypothetical protein B5X24_HaOG212861 [Helicoverpa armigera]